MKNFSFALNVSLLLAVAGLYYMHFAGKECREGKKVSRKVAVIKDSAAGGMAIAYIEMDSLYDRIPYVKNQKKELEQEQKSIESEWESGYSGLEARKNDFLKKGSSITEQMAQEFQGQLLAQKDKIDMRKDERLQKLSEKQYKFMEDFQSKLKGFLKDYNEQKQFAYIFSSGTGLDYLAYKDSALDITDDVVDGMNELLKGAGKK
jgi:outer membrane protein